MYTKKQKELVELFNTGRISKYFGTTLSYDEQGHAHLDLPYNPNVAQHSAVHVGIIATLLDAVGRFTIGAQSKASFVTTSQLNFHFLSPARECGLHAEGWVVKSGERICVAEMRVTKDDGEVVAVGTGTFFLAYAAADFTDDRNR